jgi:hypothetical protein
LRSKDRPAVGIALERVPGPALRLGFRTGSVAIVIAARCVDSVFLHRNLADPNMLLHFFKDTAMAGDLLQIVVFGADRNGLNPPLEAHKAA